MVYWRKWWGVRNDVINTLTRKYCSNDSTYEEPYSFNLDVEDCYAIIKILEKFNNEELWESEGQSIWCYAEDHIQEQIEEDIKTLHKLANFLKSSKYNELKEKNLIEVYFYDSY